MAMTYGDLGSAAPMLALGQSLGDLVTGGPGRRAEANYNQYLGEAFDTHRKRFTADEAMEEARIARAKALARESLPAAIASSGLQMPELASAILGMADGQPNFSTYTGGLKDLGAMDLERQTLGALERGDIQTARNISAVVNNKVLPELGAAGSAVFTPLTGDVAITPLGQATIGQRDAAAGASNAIAGLRNVQANAGGWNPSTGKAGGIDVFGASQDLLGTFGGKISSTVRPVLNIGAGARSQHPKGTAFDFVPKDRSQVEAIKAWGRSRGFEVIDEMDGKTGTGPHLHFELPPGAVAARGFGKGGDGAGAGSQKITEGQSKDLVYLQRGQSANNLLETMAANLTPTSGQQGARGIFDQIVRGLPGLGDSGAANFMVSGERQQAEQAGREFLSAVLRKDTGAAITQQEMDIYGATYLPQPGDSPGVLAQKAASRQTALDAIENGLGTARPMYQRPVARAPATQAAVAAPAASVMRARNPATGQVLELHDGRWIPAQ